MTKTFKAVIWDFGGVFTSSPFDAFARYEVRQGLPKDFIRTVNAHNPLANAWALLEQSKVSAEEFDGLFREEAIALGHDVPGKDILALLSGEVRPAVVEALKVCKRHGKVGCITNNAPVGKGASMTNDSKKAEQLEEIFAQFDHLIESSKIGIRKPDPRIYALMCEALDVEPADCVYLDDLGINLKPAAQMGMTTIKVLNEGQLLADLKAATGYEVV